MRRSPPKSSPRSNAVPSRSETGAPRASRRAGARAHDDVRVAPSRSRRRAARAPELALNTAASYGVLPGLIGFWIRRAQVKVLRSFARHLAPLAVTPTEVAALILIESNDRMSQIALANALGTDQSTVVNMLLALERRGYISRIRLPEDRRYQVLSVAANGRAALRRIKSALVRHNRTMQASLTAAEQRALIRSLERFVES